MPTEAHSGTSQCQVQIFEKSEKETNTIAAFYLNKKQIMVNLYRTLLVMTEVKSLMDLYILDSTFGQ